MRDGEDERRDDDSLALISYSENDLFCLNS